MRPGVIFDLDQTLLDTSSLAHLREARNWKATYDLIPGLAAFDGIDKIMQYLQDRDITSVIVTTSPAPYCNRIVKHCGWNVAGQITFWDVKQRKPHPEAFLKAINDFDLDIQQTISAGDRDIDIIASSAANIPSIACTWASPDTTALLNCNPTYVANTPEQLLNTIIKFFN